MLKYKKAQLSETMTWIVATIIIIISLSFFIFLADALAQKGAIKNVFDGTFSNVNFELNKEINVKTEMAFNLNDLNQEEINKWINEDE